ncbi:MAG: hypothetical protein JWP57_3836 [Spirosoma sp.]|nr:hypothetical protein [Spirosoma sp.]
MKTLVLFLFCGAWLTQASAQSADESSIKALLEKQTKAGLTRDAAGMIQTWANVPYASRLVSLPTGKVVFYTNEDLTQPQQISQMVSRSPGEASEFTHTDYQVRINGASAFVTFISTVSKADGQKQYAHEVRYLEKLQQAWKVVHASQVFYTPAPDQARR